MGRCRRRASGWVGEGRASACGGGGEGGSPRAPRGGQGPVSALCKGTYGVNKPCALPQPCLCHPPPRRPRDRAGSGRALRETGSAALPGGGSREFRFRLARRLDIIAHGTARHGPAQEGRPRCAAMSGAAGPGPGSGRSPLPCAPRPAAALQLGGGAEPARPGVAVIDLRFPRGAAADVSAARPGSARGRGWSRCAERGDTGESPEGVPVRVGGCRGRQRSRCEEGIRGAVPGGCWGRCRCGEGMPVPRGIAKDSTRTGVGRDAGGGPGTGRRDGGTGPSRGRGRCWCWYRYRGGDTSTSTDTGGGWRCGG